MTEDERRKHLAGLATLDGEAMKIYDINDQEQYDVVASALRTPMARIKPTAARHQPSPDSVPPEEIEAAVESVLPPETDQERAERAAERWRLVVRDVQSQAAAEGRIIYI